MLYFGALLGVGFLTQMTTPFVWIGVAIAIAQGPAWGAGFGAGFGIGRAIPVWRTPLDPAELNPDELTEKIVLSDLRSLGFATGLLALVPSIITVVRG